MMGNLGFYDARMIGNLGFYDARIVRCSLDGRAHLACKKGYPHLQKKLFVINILLLFNLSVFMT